MMGCLHAPETGLADAAPGDRLADSAGMPSQSAVAMENRLVSQAGQQGSSP